MPTNQITHRNHYIPRFYLKNWSLDGRNIYVYSLLVPNSSIKYWNCRSIKSTAVWNDFYTQMEEKAKTDEFEKWFDKEFESPSKIVFDKLNKGNKLNEDDSRVLSRFIGAQYIRTPAQYNYLMEWCSKNIPQIFEEAMQYANSQINKNLFKDDHKAMTSEEEQKPPIKVKLENEKKQVRFDTVLGREMYLYLLEHILTSTVDILKNHKWQVVHAAPGILFPTSDDPVICLNYIDEKKYDFKGGWGMKNGNIIMPISPNLLLITQIGCTMSVEKLDYSEYWSRVFRKMIIEHAHRYVYAIEPQKGMLAINPRRVNEALYNKEKNIMAGWHDEQLRAEASLINSCTK